MESQLTQDVLHKMAIGAIQHGIEATTIKSGSLPGFVVARTDSPSKGLVPTAMKVLNESTFGDGKISIECNFSGTTPLCTTIFPKYWQAQKYGQAVRNQHTSGAEALIVMKAEEFFALQHKLFTETLADMQAQSTGE